MGYNYLDGSLWLTILYRGIDYAGINKTCVLMKNKICNSKLLEGPSVSLFQYALMLHEMSPLSDLLGGREAPALEYGR
jgi:hypothetical protein